MGRNFTLNSGGLTGFLFVLTAITLTAADWPGFRGGASQSASSPETGLLQEWPADGPPLRWITRVDEGYGQPAVVNGVIYIGGKPQGQHLALRALRLADGSVIWSSPSPSPGGSSPTPYVSNGLVYWNGGRRLFAFDAAAGTTVWSVEVATAGEMPDGWRDTTGYGPDHGSLMVAQNKVFYTTGFPNAPVIALDAKTGAVLWRCHGATEANMRGWSSPVVVFHNGRDLVLAQTLHHLLGIDAGSGRVLWERDVFGFDKNGKRPANALGNGPIYADGHIFVSSSYSGNPGIGFLVSEDGATLTEAYRTRAIWPTQDSMLRVGHMIFGTGSLTKEECQADPGLLVNGMPIADFLKHRGEKDPWPWDHAPRMVCMDLRTGKPLGVLMGKERGIEQGVYGSMMLVYADGRLYGTMSGGPRQMMLYEATPAMTVRGRFELPVESELASGKREKVGWHYFTAPVIADGRLLIRRNTDLLCYDVRGIPK